jgi:hypothetical protein
MLADGTPKVTTERFGQVHAMDTDFQGDGVQS